MGIWNVIQIISPQKNIKYTDVTCTYITDYLGNTILQKMYCSCTIYLRDRKTEITYGIRILTVDICMPNPLLKTISS